MASSLVAAMDRPALGCQDPTLGDPSGVQVLTQGPVHEAFAEPVVYDPQPGPVIPRQPPAPIEEMPPDQKPEGDNVQWIPGYWAWDDGRSDFLWISGIWRVVPPGRQWVPGYWNQADRGYQWIPGFWAPLAQQAEPDQPLQYLPTPPPSMESGPNTPPPSADVTWVPGCWYWLENRYVWRPGFWVPVRPDWMWVPAHYVWTPNGNLFVDGYWDRPLATRGQMFAPVYFQQPVYSRANFAFTPSVAILANALMTSLFVRPSVHSYYFGDYYAPNNFQSGIFPWYSFHQSRYGYDPIYAHASAINLRRDPGWVDQMHEAYRYRREHPDARPPRTFLEQSRIAQEVNSRNTTTNVAVSNFTNNVNNINNFTNNTTQISNVNNARQIALARPIAQLASSPQGPLRFERLDEGRRRQFTQQASQIRQFHQERARQEVQARAARPPEAIAAAPRPLQLPRSPIADRPLRTIEAPAAGHPARPAPPPRPATPGFDHTVRPTPPAQEVRRHEPHPDQRPPAHLQAIGHPGQQQPAARPAGIRPIQPNLRPMPENRPAPERRPEPPRPAPARETPRPAAPARAMPKAEGSVPPAPPRPAPKAERPKAQRPKGQ